MKRPFFPNMAEGTVRVKAETATTQSYRVRNSIENLKLKITVKRVKLNDR